MRQISGKWKGAVLLLMLSVLLLFGSGKKVSAAPECEVVFANAKGIVSTQTYRDWGMRVEKGDWIRLPKYSKRGYKCYWVLENGNTIRKYRPGAKFRITRDTEFRLYRYKLYNVRFMTGNGRKEYTSIRDQQIKGGYITLPAVPHNASTKGLGWATSVNGKDYKQAGTRVKVTGNMKFYPVTQKIKGVQLRMYNGKLWRTVDTASGKTPTFPGVGLDSGNMVLGWSRTKGKTSNPEYFPGDKIPTKSGSYYMVVYRKNMDKAPSVVRKPTKYDMVYFVGDSRTRWMMAELGDEVPDNVKAICKSGQGLSWFKRYGFSALKKEVLKQPKNSKIAVVMNLGVNDLRNYNAYANYMSRVARTLKKYRKNCTMYYMSVNPVNSQLISRMGMPLRTEAQVETFNDVIRRKLCSGSKRCYNYINTNSYLQKYGWISDYRHGRYDGLHYSDSTYRRIYDYCIRILNR